MDVAEYASAQLKWEGLLAAELTEAGAARDNDLVSIECAGIRIRRSGFHRSPREYIRILFLITSP
jgi:hypothetical protein